jgi:clan AA aspartic protease (TIGR02281 family)
MALKYIPKADKYYRAWVYSTLAKIYYDFNDSIKAINYMTQAIKAEPQNTDWYIDRGLLYENYGNYQMAIADLQHVIKTEPGRINAYVWLGDVYHSMGQYDKALLQFQYANRLGVRPYTYGLMARSELAMQRYEDAADHMMKAFQEEHYEDYASDLISEEYPQLLDELIPRVKVQMAKNPSSVEWKLYLVSIYREKKQYEDAILLAKEIKNLDSDPFYDHIISDLYEDLGDFSTALQFAQSALQADTTETSYQYSLINLYSELNRLDDALRITDGMIAQYPDYSNTYAARANINFDLGNYAKAIEDYNTAIAINSNHHFARFKRGYSYLLNGDTIHANKDFQYLTQEAEGEIEQAFAFLHLGQTQQARIKADSILQSDTIYYTERYNVACCYALMGETELAFALLEQELQDGYNHFNHIRRDPDFISLRGQRLDSLLSQYENLVQERVRAFQTTSNDSTDQQRVVEVPFTAANGVTKVDCTINNLPLNFIFDTGASDVTLSQVEANFMFKNGYLSSKDVIGKQRYQTADGNISVGTTILLKEVQFAGLTLTDVRASVVKSQNAPLLLGQTVLQRLGKIEIDNARRVLKITTNQ